MSNALQAQQEDEVEQMKIENNVLGRKVQNEQPFARAGVAAAASFEKSAKAKFDALDKSARVGQTGYGKEELMARSALEELEEKFGGQMDAAARKNQMAVLSNTMTPEDYKKAQEQGFSIHNTGSETIVTVSDEIKAQLAKAGVDVSNMGGSLTKEQLEELSGSIAAASQLERYFEAADLPATEENMTEGFQALGQARELQPLSKNAIKYMLDNHLNPSIANLYLAEFSGNAVLPEEEEIAFEAIKGQVEQVIAAAGSQVNEQTLSDGAWMIRNRIALTVENFSYMQKLSGLNLPAEDAEIASAIVEAVAEGERPMDAMLLPEYTIKGQAEHAVEVVTGASDEDLAYLVSNHMELTIENLEQAAALRRQGAQKAAESAEIPSEGRGVQKAAESAEVSAARRGTGQQASVAADENLALLTAKRVLEETRLAMTTEANRALLKRGISIDTKPLEELVEQLKEQENSYYKALLGESEKAASSSMAELFEETTQKVSDLKQMPAYVLGMRGYRLDTVNGLHEAGSALKSAMEKAGESYETLMTAPRRELGDSIQKAFANVDDILRDLNLETSEANQRAVRILAYNSLEINEESILTMKAADEQVQRTFSNLTPAAVRELIRQGSNPLDMNLEELNRQVKAIRETVHDTDTERFSEYLWKLDQNHGISPQERESFIGVYRLMNQIEKTDGAAIGALVSQGAEFTMRNLLTAVRSAKKSGMEYTVDDDFAGVDSVQGDSKSITDQIETAYQAGCMKDVMETLTPVTMQKLLESPDWENYTPEQLKEALADYAKEEAAQENQLNDAYAREQLEELKQAAAADEDVYRFLSRYELPNTVSNILAANRFINRRSQVFSQVFNSDDVFSGEQVDFEGIKEEILGRFANALKTPKEMAAAQEVLAETAENVMKTMLADDEHITSMDIRELKLMNTQISIAGKLAQDEEYTIPVLVGDEVTNISLKIVRGVKKKGMVEVMFETAKTGKVAASIEARENGISGLVAVDDPRMKQLLESNMPEFIREFGEEEGSGHTSVPFGKTEGDIQVAYVESINFSRFSKNFSRTDDTEQTDAEMYEVQTARLYKIAKSFIEHVKKLEI